MYRNTKLLNVLDLTGPPSGTTLTVVADQNVDKQLFATATINVPPYDGPVRFQTRGCLVFLNILL